MAKKHGKNFRVYLDAENFSGVSNNTAINWATAMAETTTFTDGFVTRISGVSDWSAVVSGFYDTGTDGSGEFDEKLQSTIAGSLLFGAFPNKANDGEIGWEGTPYNAEYALSGPVDGPVATTLNLTGSARLSRTQVLSSCTALTVASANGTPVNIGGGNSSAVGFLRITSASSGTGSALFTIEHSAASDAGFAALITFSETAASGAWTLSSAVSPSAWIQAAWAVTGSDTNVGAIISVETYS